MLSFPYDRPAPELCRQLSSTIPSCLASFATLDMVRESLATRCCPRSVCTSPRAAYTLVEVEVMRTFGRTL